MKKKVEIGTVVRTCTLILALVNQFLEIAGFCPLPLEQEKVYETLTGIFTAAASLCAWWKNNSFSQEALMADEWLREEKEEKREKKEPGKGDV